MLVAAHIILSSYEIQEDSYHLFLQDPKILIKACLDLSVQGLKETEHKSRVLAQ